MTGERAWPPPLEAPGALLGGLQRGLGSAAREVLEGSVADPCRLVLSCVQADPRWDREIDDRADYYAVLALAVGVDAARVEVLARDRPVGDGLDPGPGLALEVLARMAVRGDVEAISAVRRYFSTGRYWGSLIDWLMPADNAKGGSPAWPVWVDQLALMLCERFSTVESMAEALADDAWGFSGPPWPSWRAAHPLIDHALATLTCDRPRNPSASDRYANQPTSALLALDSPELSRRVAGWLARREDPADIELLRRAAQDPSLPMHAAAVNALAAQHGREALPAVLALSEHTGRGVRQGLLFNAFVKLPYVETRAVAADWLVCGDATRRSAASKAFATHAVEDDVRLVARELSRELDENLDGDQYVVCSLAEALGRHPACAPYPMLARAFREMPYSYGRHYVGSAIAATDPGFPDEHAIDALWDCEPTVRAIAAKHASREIPGVEARLREMLSDPFEDADARDAAA